MICDLNINKVYLFLLLYKNYISKKILNKNGYSINCFEADYQNKYDIYRVCNIILRSLLQINIL